MDSEIVLEVENTPIKCKKQELMQHSDYFKAMFEGNFIEKHKSTIKLEGISLKSMNIILLLLMDRDNTILIEKEEDAISALETSCMLQFTDIKAICINRLLHILSPRNCVRIWLFAEQLDLKSLHLKAKSMALIEFDAIKDMDILLDFDLIQLQNYLANTSLQCKSELDVFQLCMKWWYENSEKLCQVVDPECVERFCTDKLVYFLTCLHFGNLSNSDIQEMMTYPDLSKNSEILKILKCVIDIKSADVADDCNKNVLEKAKKLCSSNPRTRKQLPCISVHSIPYEHPYKKQKVSFPEKETLIVYYDVFKRKRYYEGINSTGSSITFVRYDKIKDGFTKLLTIGKQKCSKLEGFHVMGYKEFIFLFGGEFVMGHGNWNKNFWVYNTITDTWERNSVMPFARRHFQSCIGGSYLYIIGGTGNYRVLQENMFWYNFKEDKWSKQIKLPCAERQVKCCCWNDQLVIFNVNDKCAYFFDLHSSGWTKMSIQDDQQLVANFPNEFSAFAHESSIYIKGDSIIEMTKKNQQLVIVNCVPQESVIYDEIESIVCDDILYTLYRQPSDIKIGAKMLSFKKYCFQTKTSEFIFKDLPEGSLINLEGDRFAFKMSTMLFALQYYELVASNDFVNDL